MARHVFALPFPGRGDINPLMDLCRSVVFRSDDILVTIAVTEEWFAVFGGPERPRHPRIRVACIENVQFSDLVKAAGGFRGFIEAVLTEMEAPTERLLSRLEKPPCLLISDAFLLQAALSVGERRNIPVAAFWPTSATMFTLYRHFHLLEQNGHYPFDLSGTSHVSVNYVPGLSPTSLGDIHGVFKGLDDFVLPKFREAFSFVSRTQCVLLSSIYELEQQAVDALRADLSIPVFTVASSVNSESRSTGHDQEVGYIEWLDNRPNNSVLYIALGSHVPVSPPQMGEFVAGLRESGVSFMLVARSGADMLKKACGEKGFVVPWCDQLRVLSHKSVGGFWSHCGWNSTKEGTLAGIPFLTFPVYGDQIIISKLIVEDWRTGWRIKEDLSDETVVQREKITDIVKKFMNTNDEEPKEMRRRAKELQKRVFEAVGQNGSWENNIDSFTKIIYSLSEGISK